MCSEFNSKIFREDIDSGSSIPPLSPPYNQHHHTTFSDDDKVYSASSSSATTTISTIEMPKKVVYSREDILHENAGKGGAHSARRWNIKSRLCLDDHNFVFNILGSKNVKCGRSWSIKTRKNQWEDDGKVIELSLVTYRRPLQRMKVISIRLAYLWAVIVITTSEHYLQQTQTKREVHQLIQMLPTYLSRSHDECLHHCLHLMEQE